MECISRIGAVVIRIPDDFQTTMFFSVTMTAAYAKCFVLCDWEDALDSAGTLFNICDIDDGNREGGSIDHMLLRVRRQSPPASVVLFTLLTDVC